MQLRFLMKKKILERGVRILVSYSMISVNAVLQFTIAATCCGSRIEAASLQSQYRACEQSWGTGNGYVQLRFNSFFNSHRKSYCLTTLF